MEDEFEVEERLVGCMRVLLVHKWVWGDVGRFAKGLKQESVLDVVGWVL